MRVYDASPFSGVSFWMKTNKAVRVEFVTLATLATAEGGECGKQDPDQNCNNHFGAMTESFESWMPFSIGFTDLAQRSGGTATWNPRELVGVSFLVEDGDPFDIWIDHITFFTQSLPAPPQG